MATRDTNELLAWWRREAAAAGISRPRPAPKGRTAPAPKRTTQRGMTPVELRRMADQREREGYHDAALMMRNSADAAERRARGLPVKSIVERRVTNADGRVVAMENAKPGQ